ncbi:MAG: endonuclease III [Gracilibacter sp. BRH_c7a]|nr:MAG: endonuclease III [Gracilibacter sp. BRH_c7a]
MSSKNYDSEKKSSEILKLLAMAYPDAYCELTYKNPFELLIATILSAQATDQKVNQITSKLFPSYPTPADMLRLTPSQLEAKIKSIGLYRTKAHNILETCRILVEDYDGEVPKTLAELINLPGVGRKTANVVLANAFGVPAFPVDTHVLRVSNRLGLAQGKNPFEVENTLTALIPSELWIDTHHQLIFHGRRVCSAKNPQCGQCLLREYCPSSKADPSSVASKSYNL